MLFVKFNTCSKPTVHCLWLVLMGCSSLCATEHFKAWGNFLTHKMRKNKHLKTTRKWKEKSFSLPFFPQKFHCSTKLKIQSDQTNASMLTFRNLHKNPDQTEWVLNCVWICLSMVCGAHFCCLNYIRLYGERWSIWGQNILQNLLRGFCMSEIIHLLCCVYTAVKEKKKKSNSSIGTTYPSWTNTTDSHQRTTFTSHNPPLINPPILTPLYY